jgi:type III pantothenate kinase
VRALLLDVGNTRLKWGIAENGEIHRTGSVTQEKIRENGLGVLTTRLPRAVDTAIVSNVAGPTFATRLAGVVGAHCGCDLHFAKTERAAFDIRNSYKQPRRMGVDRWVAMIGAWAELQSACLVVDAGTAVTIDAIDDDGCHLGGQILPGVVLMASALAQQTNDIPPTKPAAAGSYDGLDMFGQNTREAVGSGALGAVAGAVERAIRTLRSNACDASVVLTGGDASRILTALDTSPLHRPNLVLHGLMQMLERRR